MSTPEVQVTDADRLDWVIANRNIRFHLSIDKTWTVLDCRYGLTGVVDNMKTSRDAIDAAMRLVADCRLTEE